MARLAPFREARLRCLSANSRDGDKLAQGTSRVGSTEPQGRDAMRGQAKQSPTTRPTPGSGSVIGEGAAADPPPTQSWGRGLTSSAIQKLQKYMLRPY